MVCHWYGMVRWGECQAASRIQSKAVRSRPAHPQTYLLRPFSATPNAIVSVIVIITVVVNEIICPISSVFADIPDTNTIVIIIKKFRVYQFYHPFCLANW